MDPFEGRYRYCPRCRCEYRPGFDLCTDCGVDLVDELPAEAAPDLEALQSWVGSDPVEVLRTFSEFQAHLVRGALVDADIPAAVFGSGHHGYYGHVTRLVPFPFRIMVHKDDEAEARELLATECDDRGVVEPDG